MKKEDAIDSISYYLTRLGYKTIQSSLETNNYGKNVNISCTDIERMNNMLNDLFEGKTYQEIAKTNKISAPRVNDIVNTYINYLDGQAKVQDRMMENCINESNINDELNEKEFLNNYQKVLNGEYPDKYYLYLPAQSLDLNLTDTYATSLYDLLLRRKNDINDKIEKNPVLLFARLKEMYKTMDYDDRDRLELFPVINEIKSKIDYDIELDDRSDEEKLAEIEEQFARLENKKTNILKKLFKNK